MTKVEVSDIIFELSQIRELKKLRKKLKKLLKKVLTRQLKCDIIARSPRERRRGARRKPSERSLKIEQQREKYKANTKSAK